MAVAGLDAEMAIVTARGLGATLNSSERIAELQADHLLRLYQLTEQAFKSAAGVQGEDSVEPSRGDLRSRRGELPDRTQSRVRPKHTPHQGRALARPWL